MKRKTLLALPALLTMLFGPIVAGRSAVKVTSPRDQVIRITASTFQFSPSEIRLKKGVPVILELTSDDRHHGFKLPDFHLRADIQPGVVETIRFVPDRIGKFTFICDVFCGDGHEDMSGTLVVTE